MIGTILKVECQVPNVSRTQHKACVVPVPWYLLTFRDPVMVVDQANQMLAVYAKNYLEMEWVRELAAGAWDEAFLSLGKRRSDDSRGSYNRSVDLGIWRSRGEKRYYYTPATKSAAGKRFIKKHARIWKVVADLLTFFAPELRSKVQHSLFESMFGELFHFAVVNLDCKDGIVSHKDFGDFGWCCVIPFGQYTGGELRLTYAGVQLATQPTDVILLRSKEVYHEVMACVGRRGSIVLTNHSIVLNERQKTMRR